MYKILESQKYNLFFKRCLATIFFECLVQPAENLACHLTTPASVFVQLTENKV